ncbi:MAG: ABC transporter substrate-binding protein [Bacilli bacterium]|jgi:ABC-type glycerol-3-phosphate transport system substrate-binding protein
MMQRLVKVNVMLALFVLSSTLSGCINKPKVDEIKIALDIEDDGRYDELFELYKEQTGITVKATYGQDVGKLIGTKDEPDIIKTSTVIIEAMRPSLTDLTTLINGDATLKLSDYLDPIIEALTIDEKVYALPTSVNTSLLYYNKAMFNDHETAIRSALNLGPEESIYPQPSWTYADFQKAGVAMTKFSGAPPHHFGAETQLNWWGEWYVYVQQMGGSFYVPNTNNHKVALTTPEVIAATTFFREKAMGAEGVKFSPNANEMASANSFLAGNVAMIFGGHLGDWFSYDAIDLDWDIEVLPKPVGRPEAPGGELSADAFGISVRSKKVQESFGFLKLWAGKEGALKMYEHGKIGALKNMQAYIEELPSDKQKNIKIEALFAAINEAIVLPREQDFANIMRNFVMSELYKLMIDGRGAETDVVAVLTKIERNVNNYYRDLYGDN